MLRASSAALFVVPLEHHGHDHLRMAVDVASHCPALRRVILVDGGGARGPEGSVPVLGFDSLLMSSTDVLPPRETNPDNPTTLLFTSGTEATPKGIVHTHNTANYSLKTCSPLWGLTPDDNVLVAAPMGHGAGFQWCHRVALHVGSAQVLMDRWSGPAAAALVADEQCNFTYAPTRFLLDLVNEAGRTPLSMRRFASGGAPIPRVLVEQARERMDCLVFATYGQTECFVATTTSDADTIEKISNTDGCSIPGAAVRIVSEDGVEVPRGEPGECITAGPHVAGGYLTGTAPGQMSFRDDGYLWTGDRCVMDEDGYIRVLGRTREMIIRNGLNISPAEVESYLLELPNVTAAAVVGKPDDTVGERTCAFYVVADGAPDLSIDDVTRHFDQRGVAKYKWPEFVVAIDELPYSAVGKVQRGRLKERADEL
jgi:acyl-CoA synthetase (AMP-forming)/AMP-acid ligase II